MYQEISHSGHNHTRTMYMISRRTIFIFGIISQLGTTYFVNEIEINCRNDVDGDSDRDRDEDVMSNKQ